MKYRCIQVFLVAPTGIASVINAVIEQLTGEPVPDIVYSISPEMISFDGLVVEADNETDAVEKAKGIFPRGRSVLHTTAIAWESDFLYVQAYVDLDSNFIKLKHIGVMESDLPEDYSVENDYSELDALVSSIGWNILGRDENHCGFNDWVFSVSALST
jgi:hypothetical protein